MREEAGGQPEVAGTVRAAWRICPQCRASASSLCPREDSGRASPRDAWPARERERERRMRHAVAADAGLLSSTAQWCRAERRQGPTSLFSLVNSGDRPRIRWASSSPAKGCVSDDSAAFSTVTLLQRRTHVLPCARGRRRRFVALMEGYPYGDARRLLCRSRRKSNRSAAGGLRTTV
jgi:hypothetical protein